MTWIVGRIWLSGINGMDPLQPCKRCSHTTGNHYNETLAPGRPQPPSDAGIPFTTNRDGCSACECTGFIFP